jgi:hypothetical protein
VQTSVGVQRPATAHGRPGAFNAAAPRYQDILHCVMDLRLAGIHHAARKDQQITTGRRSVVAAAQG